MSRWNLAWLIGIPAVALFGLTIAYSAPQREKDRDYELVRLVVDVLDEVDKNYVRELDPEAKRKLVEDMINGGLEHLDQHSTYMSPKLGQTIRLRVSLPGGYEFEANAVVKWRREQGGDAPPGFGAQFTGITPEARQLVQRYVRNREPLFYDEL